MYSWQGEVMSSSQISQRSNRLQTSVEKLSIEITGQMYADLERIKGKIQDAKDVKAVVELALELILEAEDKEIRLVKDGKIVSTYNIWKR